jgi:hypothetical protein
MRLHVLSVAALVAVAACSRPAERPREEGRVDAPVLARAARASHGERAKEPLRPAAGRGDRHARAAAGRARPAKRIDGTLARLDGRLLVIRSPAGSELTLRTSPSTRVTLEGRPAELESLREGAEVRATYESGGGRPAALSVEARRARPAPGDGGQRRGSPEPHVVGD